MDGTPVDSDNTTEGRRSPPASPGLSGKENSRDLPEKSGQSTTGQGKEGLLSSSRKKRNEPCRRYRAGTCQAGSRCRFQHDPVNNDPRTSIEGPSAPETAPAIPVVHPPPVEATSSSAASAIKQAICRHYEDGYCKFGSMCRYRHDPVNNDPQKSIEGPSAPENAPAIPATHPPPPVEATSSSAASATKQGEKAKDSSLTGITTEFSDWSPQDDGITATRNGKALSRQEFNDHIEEVLHGPSRRSRLPAFSEFCPEPEE